MKFLTLFSVLWALSTASAFGQSNKNTNLVLSCQLTNIFEASRWILEDEGEVFNLHYVATDASLHYPDLIAPLQSLGIFQGSSAERLKSASIRFEKTHFFQHATEKNIVSLSTGPTKIVLSVEVQNAAGETVTEEREAPLHWANFDSALIHTTTAQSEGARLEGVLGFYGEGTEYHPRVQRTLVCD